MEDETRYLSKINQDCGREIWTLNQQFRAFEQELQRTSAVFSDKASRVMTSRFFEPHKKNYTDGLSAFSKQSESVSELIGLVVKVYQQIRDVQIQTGEADTHMIALREQLQVGYSHTRSAGKLYDRYSSDLEELTRELTRSEKAVSAPSGT